MGKEGTFVHASDLEATTMDIQTKMTELDSKVEEKTDKLGKDHKDLAAQQEAEAAKTAAELENVREESRNYVQDCVDELKKQLTQSIESTQATMSNQLESEISALSSKTDLHTSELGDLRVANQGLEERLRSQKAELTKEFQRELEVRLGKQASDFEIALNKMEVSLAEWKRSIYEQTAEQQKQREKQVHADLLENIRAMTAEKITHKAGEVMHEIQERLNAHDKQLVEVDRAVRDELCGHGLKVDQEIARVSRDTMARIVELEKGSCELQKGLTTMASTATKSVEWIVPDIMKQLDSQATGPQSWFSPVFSAAGELYLQLELQIVVKVPAVEGATEVIRVKDEADSAKPKKKSHDDKPVVLAQLSLWAGNANTPAEVSTLSFRVSLAGMFGPIQENKFDAWSAYPAGRTWRLDERLCKENGSLRIEAEFIAGCGSGSLIRFESAAPTLSLPPHVNSSSSSSPAGNIVVHRHVDNRADERMKSCIVRRIEWRMDQASGLKGLFPKGECICSNSFSAAGLDGLQLVFYPLGCSSAPTGYASLFLVCPGDTMPKIWLHAGRHRMEALHEELQPGWVGRAKYWVTEKIFDQETDQVCLVVEIQEAPCDILNVHAANDPRRYLQKTFAGGVEVRARANNPRPPSSSSKKSRRPAPPLSDSTLAKGAATTQWMTQAYVDSAQGYKSGASPRCNPRAASTERRLPSIDSSPSPTGLHPIHATAPIVV